MVKPKSESVFGHDNMNLIKAGNLNTENLLVEKRTGKCALNSHQMQNTENNFISHSKYVLQLSCRRNYFLGDLLFILKVANSHKARYKGGIE